MFEIVSCQYKVNIFTMLRQIIKISVVTSKAVNIFQRSGSRILVELLPGKSFLDLRPTLKTIKLEEKSKRSTPGTSYEQKLSCNITINEENNSSQINYLEHSQIFLKLEYSSGECEIMGSPEFPVYLNASMDVDNSSVYKLEFSCNTIYRLLKLIEK